ncbi:inositol-pentakisphosphate 2-kinase isoform X2 [Hydra vulgaris]|uniref:Inositol-pentakisphosphate 2-kinase n=1 Tax=Hydra vulgaris TaxID=6087 RepID=A0ABM4CK33_HYDVU
MFRFIIMEYLIMQNFEEIKWSYVGEGNENIIVKPENSKVVARLRKKFKDMNEFNYLSGKSSKKLPNMFSLKDEKMFLDFVVRFLINSCYLVDIKIIEVSEYFLLQLNNKIKSYRPLNRWEKDLDLQHRFVQLLPNLCFTPSVKIDSKCISVEIKTKCGFMPYHYNVHSLKKKVCRFCIQQVTKFNLAKTSQISSYCPLDLFNNCTCGVSSALNSLIMTPQNNLVISIDGEKINNLQQFNVGSISSKEILVSVIIAILKNDSFKVELLIKNNCNNVQAFCGGKKHDKHLECCQPMGKGGILNTLRSLQMLDCIDIENIHDLYNQYSSQYAFDNDFSSEIWTKIVQDIVNGIKKVSDLSMIYQYLISSTFKDCSLFITFKKVSFSDCAIGLSVVFHEETESWYEYQIKLADLAPRSVHNIPFYYNLDQDLISNYIKLTKLQV